MAYSLSIENMCQLHDDCMTGMGVRSGLVAELSIWWTAWMVSNPQVVLLFTASWTN